MAGDEAGGVGGEEHYGVGDFRSRAHAAQGVGAADALQHFLGEQLLHTLPPHTLVADYFVRRGRHQAGADHIEAQAVASGFAGQGFAQGDNAGFAGGIDGLAVLAHTPGIAADADDGAGLALNHMGQHGVDAVDGAPQVDIDLLDVFGAGLVQEQAVNRPADVVDQDVDAAEAGDGFGNHRIGFGLVGDVGVNDGGGGAGAGGVVQGGDFGGDALAGGGIQFGDGDVTAFGGEGEDDGASDVVAAAGYDDIFAFQSQFQSWPS